MPNLCLFFHLFALSPSRIFNDLTQKHQNWIRTTPPDDWKESANNNSCQCIHMDEEAKCDMRIRFRTIFYPNGTVCIWFSIQSIVSSDGIPFIAITYPKPLYGSPQIVHFCSYFLWLLLYVCKCARFVYVSISLVRRISYHLWYSHSSRASHFNFVSFFFIKKCFWTFCVSVSSRQNIIIKHRNFEQLHQMDAFVCFKYEH